jgi:hypothetical protein
MGRLAKMDTFYAMGEKRANHTPGIAIQRRDIAVLYAKQIQINPA